MNVVVVQDHIYHDLFDRPKTMKEWNYFQKIAGRREQMEVSVGKGKSVFRVCVRLTLVTDLVLITATAPDKTSPGRSKVKIYPRNDFVSITMIISHLLFLITTKVYTEIQPFIQDKKEQVCICQNEDYNSQLQWCHRSRCHAINSAIWLSLWLWN